MNYWVGTSGWSYKSWKNIFYPKELKSSEWLTYYAKFLTSVEINNSFYVLPQKAVLENWKASTPNNFLFSIKAWRTITHFKKLNNCIEQVSLFLKLIDNLDIKKGPILFQLPPSFKKDTIRLKTFIKCLPTTYRYVFEFRHQSWYCREIYDLLHRNNIAFCIFELAGINTTPFIVTSDFIYIRLHGSKEKYGGNYNHQQLKLWKDLILAREKEAYIYFDNTDIKAYAIRNAIEFQKMLAKEI